MRLENNDNTEKAKSSATALLQRIIYAHMTNPESLSMSFEDSQKAIAMESKSSDAGEKKIMICIDKEKHSLSFLLNRCDEPSNITLSKTELDAFIKWASDKYATDFSQSLGSPHQNMYKTLEEKRNLYFELSHLFTSLEASRSANTGIQKTNYKRRLHRLIKAMEQLNAARPDEVQYSQDDLGKTNTAFTQLLKECTDGEKTYSTPTKSEYPSHHMAYEYSLYLHNTGIYQKYNALTKNLDSFMHDFEERSHDNHLLQQDQDFILDALLCNTVLASKNEEESDAQTPPKKHIHEASFFAPKHPPTLILKQPNKPPVCGDEGPDDEVAIEGPLRAPSTLQSEAETEQPPAPPPAPKEWGKLLRLLTVSPEKVEIMQSPLDCIAIITSNKNTQLIALNELIESTNSKRLMDEITKYCTEKRNDGLPNPIGEKFKTVLDLVYNSINSRVIQGPRQRSQATQQLQSLADQLLEKIELSTNDGDPTGTSQTEKEAAKKETVGINQLLKENIDYSSLQITDKQFDQYLAQHNRMLIVNETGKVDGQKKLTAVINNLTTRRKVFMNLGKLTACLMEDPFPNKRRYRASLALLIQKLMTLKKCTGGLAYDQSYQNNIINTFFKRLKMKQPGSSFSYKPITYDEYSSIGKDYIMHYYTTTAYRWLNAFQRNPNDTAALLSIYNAYRRENKSNGLPELTETELHRKCLIENILLAAAIRDKRPNYRLRGNVDILSRKEDLDVDRATQSDIAAGTIATYQSKALTSASDPTAQSKYFEKKPFTAHFSLGGSIDFTQFSDSVAESEWAFAPGQNFKYNPVSRTYEAFSSPVLDKDSTEKHKTKDEIQAKITADRKSLFSAIRNPTEASYTTIQALLDSGVSTSIEKDASESETPITALIKKFNDLVTADNPQDTMSLPVIMQCLDLLLKTESPFAKNKQEENAFTLLFSRECNTEKEEALRHIFFLRMSKDYLAYNKQPYTKKANTELHAEIESEYFLQSETTKPQTTRIMFAAKNLGQDLLQAIDGKKLTDTKNYLIAHATIDFIKMQAKKNHSPLQKTTLLNYGPRLNAFKQALAEIYGANKQRQSEKMQALSEAVSAAKESKTNQEEERNNWLRSLYVDPDKLNTEIDNRSPDKEQAREDDASTPINTTEALQALSTLSAEFEDSLTVTFKAKKGSDWLANKKEGIVALSRTLTHIQDLSIDSPETQDFCRMFAKITLWCFKALAKGHSRTTPAAIRKTAQLIAKATRNPTLQAISETPDSAIKSFSKSFKRRQETLKNSTRPDAAPPITDQVFHTMKALSSLTGVPLKIKFDKELVTASCRNLTQPSVMKLSSRHSLFRPEDSMTQPHLTTTTVSEFIEKTRIARVKEAIENAQEFLGVKAEDTLTSTRGLDGFVPITPPQSDSLADEPVDFEPKATPTQDNWVITTSRPNPASSQDQSSPPTNKVELTFNRENNLRSVALDHTSLKASKLIAFLKAAGKKTINIRARRLDPNYVRSLKTHAKKAGIKVNDLRNRRPIPPNDDEGLRSHSMGS